MLSIFKRTPVKTIMENQLYEARRQAVEHEAAAEHHDALATMFAGRVARLEEALEREAISKSA